MTPQEKIQSLNAAGMSCEEIAEKCGCSAPSVYNWKAGRNKPSKHFEKRIMKIKEIKK